MLTSVDWSNPFHYLKHTALYVLQYYFYKRFSHSYKMPFTSLDCVDSLPDLGELLSEMFNPVDADQYCKDAALEELEEFGEDVLYDGELFAVEETDGSCGDCGPYVYDLEDLEVVGVQKFLLDDMYRFSDHTELSSEYCDYICICDLRYLSAVFRAVGDY